MKVYVVLYHWCWEWDYETTSLGVFTTKEKAVECLKNYAENHIKRNNNSYYDEDDCWYNDDFTLFDAHNDSNNDCEWLNILEMELNEYAYNE